MSISHPEGLTLADVSGRGVRRRFIMAAGLFIAWVAILLAMGILSANRPGLSTPPPEAEGSNTP